MYEATQRLLNSDPKHQLGKARTWNATEHGQPARGGQLILAVHDESQGIDSQKVGSNRHFLCWVRLAQVGNQSLHSVGARSSVRKERAVCVFFFPSRV